MQLVQLSSSLSAHSDPLEITTQFHFPASAAQRLVSGALVMENYQLAHMKWPLEKTSQNKSPSLSLSLFGPLQFALPPSQLPPPPFETGYEKPVGILPGIFCHGGVLNDN